MKRKKILHLITLSVVGGSQDNTFATCERHDRSRYEVHLACNPDGAWAARARAACDVFHPLPALVTPVRPADDLRAFLALLRLLRRERFDLVHTHTAKAGFLGRLAANGCGVPRVVHTYHAFPWHRFMPAWKQALYVQLERVARVFTDAFITVSENERQEGLRRGVLGARHSRTIYSGIDYEKLDRPVDTAALRRQLDIAPDRPVVLLAGRLDPQKAPLLMVEAFARVVRTQPRALLLIAGDGELRPRVEARLDALQLRGHARILGFRDDVAALMQLADVFALSSLWEGLGRALTEAMLLGRPVVAPAVNGIPEIVRHNDTGWLFDAGEADALADGIRHLLARPDMAARLGANARQLTRPLFDARGMVARIEEVFEELLTGRQAKARIVPLPATASQVAPPDRRQAA
jgi:glycosyltransferase involved in cell wall biosynthesis